MSFSLARGVRILQEGGCLIYPTETYYALGCSAFDPLAVSRVFRIKSRPRSKPLPVIIGDAKQLLLLASRLSTAVEQLTEHFWPGPLSILIPARTDLPQGLSNEQGLVCVRMSSHPGARALCLQSGFPLVASSANFSGGQPAADPKDLAADLQKQVDLLWDGPPRPGGRAPSTIVRLTEKGKVSVVRPGAIAPKALREAGFVLED